MDTFTDLRKHLRPYWIFVNQKIVWQWLLGMVALLLLFLSFTELFLLSLFVVLGAFSFLPARVTNALGFELLTLFTVTAGLGFGPIAGLFVGVFGILLGYFVMATVDAGILVSMVEYAFIGIGASMISPASFVIYGILATFFYDLILVSAYCFLLGKNPVKTIFYFLTHLLINGVLFLRLKTYMLGLV